MHIPKTANVLGFFLFNKFNFKLTRYYLFFFPATLWFLLSFSFASVKAQSNISIRGQVSDAEKGFPLPNVLIQVDDELFQTYSTQDGSFEIEYLPPGNYNLIFTLIGYEPNKIQNIAITEDVATQLLVELKRQIIQGETIDVEAEKVETTIGMEGEKIVINVDDEKSAGNNSLQKILQQVAGFEVRSTGSGENSTTISIHGSDANQVLVLLDGVRLNYPQTGEVDLGEIPFDEIEIIEVSRHGSTAMYGNGAYAGVVEFKTTEKVESAYANLESGISSFSTYFGRIGTGAPISTSFFRANYYQDYSNQNFPYEYKNQNLKRENAWYRNRKFYSKINYKISAHQFTLGFTQRESQGGLPSANFNEQAVYGAKRNEISRRVFYNYKWLLKPEFYLESISGYNYLNQTFDNSNDPSPFTKYHNNFINSVIETQVVANYQIKNMIITKFGVQFLNESLKQKDIIHPSLNSEKNSRGTKSIFLGVEYNLPEKKVIWENAKLFSAIRYQKYFTQNAELYPSVGFSFTPKLIESISFSGSWTKSVRYPDFNSLFWKGGVQSQGNPELQPEKKKGWNAGLTLDFKKQYSPYIYIFYFSEILKDLIFWDQIRNNHWQPRNLSNAEKEGWDIQIKQKIYVDYISLRTTYSRVNAKNKTTEPTIFNKKLVFIPEHTASATLLANYNNFNLLVSFRYVSKRHTVKANTANPLDEYRVWDLTINYAEQIGKITAKIELNADNITEEKYQLLRGYPMPAKVLGASVHVEYRF